MDHIFFKDLINISSTTDYPPLYIEYISISISCNHDFTDL